jgi:hypothetical protein
MQEASGPGKVINVPVAANSVKLAVKHVRVGGSGRRDP